MSLVKHREQRVAVLMDVQNMYHSAKALYQQRVNFKEVLKTALAGRKLIRAIAYVIRTETGEEPSEALENMVIMAKGDDPELIECMGQQCNFELLAPLSAEHLTYYRINWRNTDPVWPDYALELV